MTVVLVQVNREGKAIGTGINANEEFIAGIVPAINEASKLDLKQARDLIDSTQVTVLAPVIGYQKAADIAKKALKLNQSVFDIIVNEKIMDPGRAKEILDPKRMI